MSKTRKPNKPNDTVLDEETIRQVGLSGDSDEFKNILSGKTQRIPFPSLKNAISNNLTRKPDNKYKHPQKIGHGGMKQILKVKDRDTARNLAMAVLSTDSDIQETCMARFVHEARITANLEHPNIVPIHDIGVDKAGQPYFTMKLIEGESLAHVLINLAKKKPGYKEKYTFPHLLTIFLNVCNAIDFAHSKGIIHLDLKPENIQIGNYGEVLVLDWGLARVLEDADENDAIVPETTKKLSADLAETDLDKTVDGAIKGTPGFMAPEQAAGDNSNKDITTDIYSLGALLYAILTLKKPIKGVEINDVLEKTIKGELIPPMQRSPERNIPLPLAAVTMKAMELKQEDRYQDVDDLIKDINAYTDNFATSAENATMLTHLKLYSKRHKIEIYFAIIGVLAIIAAVTIFATYETKQFGQWGHGRNITPVTTQELKMEWIPISGKWEVIDNSVCAVEGNSFILLYNKPIYGNMAIEFEAEIPDPKDLKESGDLSVILAASKRDPKKRGYFFQMGGIGNTSAVIQKRGGMLAAVEFPLKPATKYKIRAEKEGSNLKLFCNGKLLISFKDIFYLEGGYIGLYTFGKGKNFSNIRIFQKDVPELVPPTMEGDSFYRESRSVTGKEKKKFLQLAEKAYTRVYESHVNSALSAESLLKRAYVNSELGKLGDALHDTILLKGFGETIDLLLLKGLLFFRSKDFDKAYEAYFKAVTKYPDSRVTTVAVLMGNLSSEKSKLIPDNLRQKLWKLCAENQSSPVLRCTSQNLKSLEFLRETKFTLIDCHENKIKSLAPLKNQHLLKQLDCADNEITSLAPLKGMQLESLECHNNPVEDITPLKDMPLTTLTLNGCTKLKDISSLKNCKTLERLTIPKHIKDLEILKNLPNLKYLNNEWDDWKMTKEEFFEKLLLNSNPYRNPLTRLFRAKH